jgi:uncharacterized protein (DUF2267 family)
MTKRSDALDQFVILTRQRTGAETESAAMKIVEAALGSLGRMLPHREAAAVQEQLPEPLDEMLGRRRGEGALSIEELPEDLARQESTDVTTAKQHAVAVCQVLLQSLSEELRTHLRSSLSGTLCDFFSLQTLAGPGRPPVESGAGEATEPAEERESGYILTGLHGTLAQRGATIHEREQDSSVPDARQKEEQGEPRRERLYPGEQLRQDDPPNVKRD